jgi:hypothetical protein
MPVKGVVAEFASVGGPSKPQLGDDGWWAGPTDPGRYVVARCGPHRSSGRYPLSKIPWGAALKDEGGRVLAMVDGAWLDVEATTGLSRDELMKYHKDLYRQSKVPSKWVFNDFGHMTCYLFRDANENGKLDVALGERVHGEFMHSSPHTEAMESRGEGDLITAHVMGESHGCIHIRPADIDQLRRARFLGRGTRVIVHGYDELRVPFPRAIAGRPPYELHFFPGLKRLVVVGISH